MNPLTIHQPSNTDLDAIGKIIVNSAFTVHKELGPGLLESAYEACVAYELSKQGCTVETQVGLPVSYGSVLLDVGYRIDILVNKAVIIELKAVSALHPVHEAQILSYLRLSGAKLGFLINFHVPLIRDGIHRRVHKF